MKKGLPFALVFALAGSEVHAADVESLPTTSAGNSSLAHPPAVTAYFKALREGHPNPLEAARAQVGFGPVFYVSWDVAEGTSDYAKVVHNWHTVPNGWSMENGVYISKMLAFEAGGGNGGYFGSQSVSNFPLPGSYGKAIFSLWDCKSGGQTKPYNEGGGSCRHMCTGEGCFTQCTLHMTVAELQSVTNEVKFHHTDQSGYQWWEWFVNGRARGQIGAPRCGMAQAGYGRITMGQQAGFMEYFSAQQCNAPYANVGVKGPWFANGVSPTQARPNLGGDRCNQHCVTGSDNGVQGGRSNPVVDMQGGSGTQCSTPDQQPLWGYEENETIVV